MTSSEKEGSLSTSALAAIDAEVMAPERGTQLSLVSDDDYLDAANTQQYPLSIRQDAYSMFLGSDKTMAEMAVELGVPMPVLSSWSRKGKWMEKKRNMDDEVVQRVERQYRMFVYDQRLPVARQQLQASCKLVGVVNDRLEDTDDMKPSEIKMLADALASASGVGARVTGMDDSPVRNDNAANVAQANGPVGGGKVPLVIVNLQPVLPSK